MFDIDRIAIHNLFGIKGLDVAWYGITMASAIVVGVIVACWQAKKKGYRADLIFDFMILAIPLAIVGARLYYVAFEWDYYSQHPEEIIAVWNGGIAMYGAVIGGCVAGIILCKWRKFPFGRLMDFVGPGAAIGQAIGRWGNFFNQEAFGNIVTDPSLQWFPYAVYVAYRDTGGGLIVRDSWVQATFFYESIWDIGVCLLCIWYAKRARHDGNVFAMYLVAYGIGRAWIEGLRVSTLQLWPGMPVSQFLSLLLVVGGVAYILVMRKLNRPNRAYEGIYCLDYVDPRDKMKAQKGNEPAKATGSNANAASEGDKTAKSGGEPASPDGEKAEGDKEPSEEKASDSDGNDQPLDSGAESAPVEEGEDASQAPDVEDGGADSAKTAEKADEGKQDA